MIDSIDKIVVLRCGVERAFSLFTERISHWWPASHRPSKSAAGILHMEPAGRFYERSEDGRETELGRVLLWEPPHRLVLDFYIGTSPAQPTAVEITFTPQEDGTQVHVRHRPKPESEALWNHRAPIFDRSWASVLGALENE